MDVLAKSERKMVAQQISPIRDYLVLGSISEDYFGKSTAWLSRKIRGVGFNAGTEGGFTEEELETFRGALLDLSEKIRATAIAL